MDERVDERHAGRSGADHEVVGLDLTHRSPRGCRPPRGCFLAVAPLVLRVDASTREHPCSAVERELGAALDEQHLEPVAELAQEDDRRCGGRGEDLAHQTLSLVPRQARVDPVDPVHQAAVETPCVLEPGLAQERDRLRAAVA